ncbi:MAG: M28 family peptidase [Sphingomicrobium sp.]
MTARWRGLLIVALLLAGFALKGWLLTPPPAQTASATGFNVGRAIGRLERILGDERAHPVDTAADDAIRNRLIAEIRAFGLEPRVQEETDCSATPGARFVSCSRVRNVIATIPSLGPGPQLLLNAHYDSTATGPGASDDGLGVAVLLEIGSILRASPPPRPVTLLFNEGEEFGLNGAHAFLRSDPLARRVNSLINIDVRGVTGPALMYETSDPNGAALGIYGEATQRPYANSVSTDFAKLIPNTTDVVLFKPRGWTLMNYGIIGNETRYHSPGDNIRALDPDSVGHVGSEVLAATRAMAAVSEPAKASSGHMVFADVAGRALIRLPLLAAGAFLALFLAVSAVLAWRTRSFGLPLATAAGMTVGGIAAGAIAGSLFGFVRAGDFWRAHPLVSYLAIYAVMLLVMTLIHARFGREIGRDRMRSASWLLILIVGSAASLALPGATIFFLVAPALALAGIALEDRARGIARMLVAAAILFQFVMIAELLALVEMLLIDGPLWAVAPFGALAVLPALAESDSRELRPAIALLATAAVSLSLGALVMSRSSAERPLAFGIEYFRDLASKSANWTVVSKQAPLPDGFPGEWKRGVLPFNGRVRWIARAPILPAPAGRVDLVGHEAAGAGRRLTLALSPGGADTISIRFPKEAKVLALGLPGSASRIPATGEPEKPLLRCSGRSCEGLQIEVILGDRKPFIAEVFATRFALPPQAGPLVGGRPSNSQPQYSPDQTITRSLIRL